MTTQVYQRTWVPVVGWLACDPPESDLRPPGFIEPWTVKVIEQVVRAVGPRGPVASLAAYRAVKQLLDSLRESPLTAIECECGSKRGLLVTFEPPWTNIEVTVCLNAYCMDTKLRQVRS